MVASLINILGSALSIWDNAEKTKYLDQLIALKKDYYAEYDKDPSVRSDAYLDDVMQQLCILSDSVSSSIGAAATPAKS